MIITTSLLSIIVYLQHITWILLLYYCFITTTDLFITASLLHTYYFFIITAELPHYYLIITQLLQLPVSLLYGSVSVSLFHDFFLLPILITTLLPITVITTITFLPNLEMDHVHGRHHQTQQILVAQCSTDEVFSYCKNGLLFFLVTTEIWSLLKQLSPEIEGTSCCW